ncbi:MAG: competence/damage-inducible protein A [Bacteroidota bacterium]
MKRPIKAEILTIGDEILYGQILDTNSQWISEQLDDIGVRVIKKTTVGDNEKDILKAFEDAENTADITLITGGLGPTNDDLTKPLLSKHFNSPLEINEAALKEITHLFESRGFKLNELNRLQALLPRDCKMISNKNGTAPGIWMERNNRVFVSMPGVPYEMKSIISETVLPWLQEKFDIPVIYHKVVKTVGIGESWLAEKIESWETGLPEHIKLAYLPSFGQVKLRLTAIGEELDVLKQDVQEEIEKLIPLAEKYIFGYDKDELYEVIGKVLKEEGKTISTAESCTGGFVASQLTSVPGSSAYFKGSVVAYSNEIKENILSVNSNDLKKHGAVSEEVVKQMAENVREKLGTDIGLSTSGIAGPDGGTESKPVGTIWIAYADKERTIAKKLTLTKKREVNIKYTSIAVLNLARISLMKTVESSI